MKNKITIWDIFGTEIRVALGTNCWECFVTKEPGQPEQYRIPTKYTKDSDTMHDWETCKIFNADLKGVGKDLRAYIKGLKILLKNEYFPRFFERAANAYKGDYTPDLNERFRKITRSFTNGRKDIIKIGMGQQYSITDYSDGSFSSYIR